MNRWSLQCPPEQERRLGTGAPAGSGGFQPPDSDVRANVTSGFSRVRNFELKTQMLHTPLPVLRKTRTLWILTGLLFLLFSPPGLRAEETPQQILDLAGKVLTVNGPVEPDSLGATMAHEHIFINRNHRNRPAPTTATRVRFYLKPLTMDMLGAVTMGYPNRDNLILGDETTALQELADYRKRGGGTLVDVTSIGLGRDLSLIHI